MIILCSCARLSQDDCEDLQDCPKCSHAPVMQTSSVVIPFAAFLRQLCNKTQDHCIVISSSLICLFCCFTSQVNSYGHGGTVSSPNHTFSWASLNEQLTSTSCTYFRSLMAFASLICECGLLEQPCVHCSSGVSS